MYCFGLGNGDVSDRETKRIKAAIAKTGENVDFIRYADGNGQNKRFWFAKQNEGSPFDQAIAGSVLNAVGKIKVRTRTVFTRGQGILFLEKTAKGRK